MSKSEKISYLIFPLLVILMIPFSLHITKNNRTRENLYLIQKKRIDELRKNEGIDAAVYDDLKTRYLWTLSRYRKTSSLYVFSQSVKDALEKEGITLVRYLRRDQGGENFIEFTVSGETESFFRFLRRFYRESQAFKIPYFTIDIRDGEGLITFLVGFDVINGELATDLALTESYEWSDGVDLMVRKDESALASIFYRRTAKKKISTPIIEDIPESSPAPVVNPKVHQLQYVGKVGTPEGVRYYIKDMESGKIITLPTEECPLLEQDGHMLRFRYRNEIYEVPLL